MSEDTEYLRSMMYSESAKSLKWARLNARKARKQRDATVTNEDFDLWHSIMLEQERILKELLLKTGEKK